MKRCICALGALALLVAVLPAGASTFLAMTETELVAESSAVVRGDVVSVDSFWNAAHTMIVTEVVIEVEKTVVGEAPRFVTLRTAGGTVDGYTIDAHGFPKFEAGERALVFVTPHEDSLRVTGYQLGHYRIQTNRFGEEIAVPTVDSTTRLMTLTGAAVEAPRARPLAAFEASLQQLNRNERLNQIQ